MPLVSVTSSTTIPSAQKREKVMARQTTHNGVPTVIFKAADYYGIMEQDCRRTIVGIFLKPRPQIDKIRSKFKELVALKGSVKFGVYDNYNVFIDCSNDEDFQNVWYRRMIEIEGLQMWMQKWTPDFKPEEGIPIAPVWVLLPELPFHMHNWPYVKQLLIPIGTPLSLDAAIESKTRPSMANVRVEVDLLKPRLNKVWVGLKHEGSPLTGFTQKVEYENIPKYCKHCKKLGQNMNDCWILERKRIIEAKRENTKAKRAEQGETSNAEDNGKATNANDQNAEDVEQNTQAGRPQAKRKNKNKETVNIENVDVETINNELIRNEEKYEEQETDDV
ncbi:hypothetical protein MTR67_023831 [Solanum verrucosum]|uniref:DUF4283 domain-containing protein n=1 Tax=Solanum verrucosum TaxID=315347 RepID=A0AAF0R1T8_SOLVR|nr:hypothetical protein MTR67_023831 [Solanum verrucosum]